MDRAELTAFLRARHHMIRPTPRRDGGRQGSPVSAELLPPPDALGPLVEYLRSVSGDHSDWGRDDGAG